MKYRLGILGCGMIGRAFARAAQSTSEFEIAAFHSRSRESMAAFSHSVPGARALRDREEILADPQVDVILVCTPHAQHVADAVDAIAAGKHVLIEKPVATTIQGLDRLEWAAATTAKTVFALPHAGYPFLEPLRELIRSGILGPVTEMRSVLDVPGPPRSNWYYSASAGGGASMDTLPYAACRLLDLVRTPVRSAWGTKGRTLPRRRCLDGGLVDSRVDDMATLTLEFASGQFAEVRSSWNVWKPEDHLFAFGRHGDARLDCWRNTLTVRCEGPLPDWGIRTSWDGVDAVEISFGSYDPELLKLGLLAEAIRDRRSNLKRVAYVMRLILGIPNGGGRVALPDNIYGSAEGPAVLQIGEGYV